MAGLRACLKIAFLQMRVTVCGRFGPNEGGVVGYVDRMRAKSPAKWGVHMAGMNFQTRSRLFNLILADSPFYSHRIHIQIRRNPQKHHSQNPLHPSLSLAFRQKPPNLINVCSTYASSSFATAKSMVRFIRSVPATVTLTF